MKKRYLILSVIICFVITFFIYFERSVKGNWSDSDKIRFSTQMDRYMKRVNFDENNSDFLRCFALKCEANFSSYREANSDFNKTQELANKCIVEILSRGSIKGNWSDIDKQLFQKDMESMEEITNLGHLKSKWIECVLYKFEAKYPSYFVASSDNSAIQAICLECNETYNVDVSVRKVIDLIFHPLFKI